MCALTTDFLLHEHLSLTTPTLMLLFLCLFLPADPQKNKKVTKQVLNKFWFNCCVQLNPKAAFNRRDLNQDQVHVRGPGRERGVEEAKLYQRERFLATP